METKRIKPGHPHTVYHGRHIHVITHADIITRDVDIWTGGRAFCDASSRLSGGPPPLYSPSKKKRHLRFAYHPFHTLFTPRACHLCTLQRTCTLTQHNPLYVRVQQINV